MFKVLFSLALVLLSSSFNIAVAQSEEDRSHKRIADAPDFRVDHKWPKALPNQWLVGQVAGVAVDRQDHVWIVQRPLSLTADEAGADQDPPRSECCHRAPSIMQFDKEGNLLRAWGGPHDPGFLTDRCTPANGCEWPTNEHGIFVDHNDNVWMGGNGAGNNVVLKFTSDGTFLLQIGKLGVTGGSNDTGGAPNGTPLLGQPADIGVDPEANEAYIADGYQNKRVLVVDADTGMYKRHWGAYGNVPDDTAPAPYQAGQTGAPQFRNPVHCAKVSSDGYLYVCDRVNNRIQVFQRDGTYVREFLLDTAALGNGSAWDVDTSPDGRWLYNADGENNKVWILERLYGSVGDTFGRNGRSAGQFHWVHNLATDSEGNIYTAEVDTGKRAQKFKPVHDKKHHRK